MARGLPDSVFGPEGQAPQPPPVSQPNTAITERLGQVAAENSVPHHRVGAGPAGTVLPPANKGAGDLQPPSADPAAMPSEAATSAPFSSGPEFQYIDLKSQTIVTINREMLPYPDDLQRHFVKCCLKIALLHRNDALQAIAEKYGTSLQEVATELEEALRENMSKVQDGETPSAVQENTEEVSPKGVQSVPAKESETQGG